MVVDATKTGVGDGDGYDAWPRPKCHWQWFITIFWVAAKLSQHLFTFVFIHGGCQSVGLTGNSSKLIIIVDTNVYHF